MYKEMEEEKKRHGCVAWWLALGLVGSGFAVLSYISKAFVKISTSEMAICCGACAILAATILLGVVLLMEWKKNGFALMVAAALLFCAVSIFWLGVNWILQVACTLLGIAIWYAILQIRQDGVSAWSQMEPGWSVKQPRRLYPAFALVCTVIVVLAAVAYCIKKDNESKENHGSRIVVEQVDN